MSTLGPAGYESLDATIPANLAAAVTPSDSVNLTLGTCRALYIGVGGNVALIPPGPGANAVTFQNAASGSILPVQARRILATGTTASGIIALY